jgi:ATP-dependent DNA helicase RecG
LSARKPAGANSAERVADQLGLARAADLILHLPLRYEDETRLTPLYAARPGEDILVEAVIMHAEVGRGPRRQLILDLLEHPEAPPGVQNPPLRMRLLHFNPGQVTQLQPGTRLRLFGATRAGLFGAEMVHPRYRVVRADTPLSTTLTPVYPTVAGLGQTALRRQIGAMLGTIDLDDSLPVACRVAQELPEFAETLRVLHAPPPGSDRVELEQRRHPAWRRLKFDELLAQQLSLKRYRAARERLRGIPLDESGDLERRFLERLPFPLTQAQRRAHAEIRADLARAHPMHRLLQGDVGSGKTCIAALAALRALDSGRQTAVMAPTEILASQLRQKFTEWLEPLGARIAWLGAGQRAAERRAALEAIASGTAGVAVGTHALFQDEVVFRDLALAIVDEQHRFGVEQRLALRAKGGAPESALAPHLLMMSATPIPRSLAMSYYADLDVSVIDELPPGRTPVDTKVISQARRVEVISRLNAYCQDGAQAYWVCPLIEESAKIDLRAALDTHEELRQALPDRRVGLAHGRMKADEKAEVMRAFKQGEIDILVATTVIEVGVDVPNAGLMVIDHAERMGLAQLHQLRGRVGRGARRSSCLLLYATPLSEGARQRLAVMRATHDGFAIAREDLRLRGPGELLGARQSGQMMLRFADLDTDTDLLERARNLADVLLRDHPDAVDRHLARWLPRGLELAGA